MCRVHSQVSRNSPFGPEEPTSESRSALAVSHDFGGLLRCTSCRFIAPCYQPWGPPRFKLLRRPDESSTRRSPTQCPPPEGDERWAWGSAFPSGATPYKAFPSPVALQRSRHSEECVSPERDSFSPLVPNTRPMRPCVATVLRRGEVRFLGLKALSTRRVRCKPAMLPSLIARCSLGLGPNPIR
jgi:hypothetical protein